VNLGRRIVISPWTPLGISIPQTPCAHPTSKPGLRHWLTVPVLRFYLFINIQWLDVEMTVTDLLPPYSSKTSRATGGDIFCLKMYV